MELFLPPAYDWFWTVAAIVVPAAMIAAIVQIARSRVLSGSAQIVWALGVLFVPILGVLAWFLARPRETSVPKQR